MTEYSISVDLGGTNLRAAAVDREGKILKEHASGFGLHDIGAVRNFQAVKFQVHGLIMHGPGGILVVKPICR